MTDRMSMEQYRAHCAVSSVSATGRVVQVAKPRPEFAAAFAKATGVLTSPASTKKVPVAPFTLSLPYPVSANKNWRNGYVSKESRAYKKQVQQIAKQHCVKPLDGDVSVTYTLHPRQNVDGSASKTRLDIFNAEKITSDALNGIAWSDDQQIVDGRVRLGSPKVGGGLTVEIVECVS